MPATPTKRSRRDTKPPARYRDAIEEAHLQSALLTHYQRGSRSPAPNLNNNNNGASPSLVEKRERSLGSRSPNKRTPSHSGSPSGRDSGRPSPARGDKRPRQRTAVPQPPAPSADQPGSPLDLLAFATSAAFGATGAAGGSQTRSADASDETIDVGDAFMDRAASGSLQRAIAIRSLESLSQSPTKTQHGTKQSHSGGNLQAAPHLMSATLRDNLKRLKNLLKLPKARRWVYCELFYGEIDKSLLLGESEFDECVRDAFPNLKCRIMNRVQWRKLRSLLGKPRRSSQAFFAEERDTLESRRRRVRALYAGRVTSLADDDGQAALPRRLTEPIAVGRKVHVRLRTPRDGLYLGTVLAVNEGEYRVSFEKSDVLPTQVVPDYEVMREVAEDEVPVMFFIDKNRAMLKRLESVHLENVASTSFSRAPEPLAGGGLSPYGRQPVGFAPAFAARGVPTSSALSLRPPFTFNAATSADRSGDRVGNYPARPLLLLVKTWKAIESKRQLVGQLAELNAQAEKLQLFGSKRYPRELQEKYAEVLMELESVNKVLSDNVCSLASFQSSLQQAVQSGAQYTGGRATAPCASVDALRRQTVAHATQIVKHCNHGLGVRSGRAIELVTDLTALLLQARELGRSQCGPADFALLSQSLASVRSKLSPGNAALFQDHVEVHIQHMHQLMVKNVTYGL